MIGIWRDDWGHVFAKDVRSHYTDISYEVWRPDFRADKIYIHRFDDGVVHRSFPAEKVIFRMGLKTSKFWSSKALLSRLERVVNENQYTQDLLLHFPLDFSYIGHAILKKYRTRVPMLHTSHLNPLLLKSQLETNRPLKNLHRMLLNRTYKTHLKYLREIAVSADRIDFFRKHTDAKIHRLDSLLFDFKWADNKISKEKARKNLGLQKNDFILLSSSRLVPEKQLDKMLYALSRISKNNYKCIISGAGEREYEEYLNKLTIKYGLQDQVIFTGFLTKNLLEYYCASDAFITTSSSEAGPVSAIKALALEIPVIATNTGIVGYLLKEHNAGLILKKDRSKEWSVMLERVVGGERIKIISAKTLEKEYGKFNSTRKLVDCYKSSIERFWYEKSNSQSTKKDQDLHIAT